MTRSGEKIRLDQLIVDRGIVPSREKARAMIMAGDVLVEDRPVSKAGTGVSPDVEIRLRRSPPPYVGRGGQKLRGALTDFAIDPSGKVAVDIGASTGGFTDCLLQAGAARVYAVDVDRSQLDWKLSSDPRVVQVEVNARYLEPDRIPEPVDIVTMDVSFISVTKILPAIRALTGVGELIVLVKPQFELEREHIGKGGVVSDSGLQAEAVDRVARAAEAGGFRVLGRTASPITGKEGNQEFFLHMERS